VTEHKLQILAPYKRNYHALHRLLNDTAEELQQLAVYTSHLCREELLDAAPLWMQHARVASSWPLFLLLSAHAEYNRYPALCCITSATYCVTTFAATTEITGRVLVALPSNLSVLFSGLFNGS